MAEPPKKVDKKSRYTEGRGIAGAFEGETVTRRRLMEGTALAAGGIATMAFALPGARLRARARCSRTRIPTAGRTSARRPTSTTRATCRASSTSTREIGDAGQDDRLRPAVQPRHRQGGRGPGPPAVRRDLDPLRAPRLPRPLHPGLAEVRLPLPRRRLRLAGPGRGRPAGAAARPLLHARRDGRVQVGDRFSLNSELERFSPRDPSNHLDGLWQYLYPSRPTT